MAQIDIFNKKFKKAVERAGKSLNLLPNCKAFYRRGVAAMELGDIDQSIHDFSKVIELDPSLEGDIA